MKRTVYHYEGDYATQGVQLLHSQLLKAQTPSAVETGAVGQANESTESHDAHEVYKSGEAFKTRSSADADKPARRI